MPGRAALWTTGHHEVLIRYLAAGLSNTRAARELGLHPITIRRTLLRNRGLVARIADLVERINAERMVAAGLALPSDGPPMTDADVERLRREMAELERSWRENPDPQFDTWITPEPPAPPPPPPPPPPAPRPRRRGPPA